MPVARVRHHLSARLELFAGPLAEAGRLSGKGPAAVLATQDRRITRCDGNLLSPCSPFLPSSQAGRPPRTRIPTGALAAAPASAGMAPASAAPLATRITTRGHRGR